MSLKITAKATEAQARAGLNSTEWKRFLTITKQEAERLATDHPEWTRWTQVYADTQADIQERVVKQLLEEKVHRIDVGVVDWRMTQVVRKVHLARTASHKETSKPADRPREPLAEQPLASSKPYDPVRASAVQNG
ncbi:hypothetical protein BU16DRAFT_527017 [Lophium mytilinum]|uniref:Uncharacterized protein n=1 Tax=Lophium mytilinum TaxID=390894 RepID=A0A6A6QRU8_9PEZI|nr:hypothetical protein BU16DRAFT_527017 [Lophium mytilinum]